MPENIPKKSRRKRISSSKTQKQAGGRYPGQEIPGLIPLMYNLVELLPEDLKPHGEKIVGILIMAIIAIVAIFIIGAFVATLTGHSDQIMTIFTYDIIGVGVVAVGAIVLTIRKSVK